MAPKKEEVTYELLTLTGGNWQTHNVYTASEQPVALADAKSLLQISNVQGVRVLKEFYDEKSGTSRHRVIYEHPKPKPKPKPKPAPKAKPAPAPKAKAKPKPKAKQTDKETPRAALQAAPRQFSKIEILLQSVYSLLISLTAAFVVSWVASHMLKDANHFPVFSREKIHTVVFLVLFVLFTVLLAARIAWRNYVLSIADAANSGKPEKHLRDPRLALPPGAIEKPLLSPIDFADEALPEEEAQTDGEDEAAPDEAPLDNLDITGLQFPPEVQGAIKSMETFVDQSLAALEGGISDADSYASFGISLYMVGAAQALSQESNIEKVYRDDVMSAGLVKIELAPDRIKQLIDRSDEYLISDPRYTQMYQVGRSAMGIWLESGLGTEEAFSMSFENWIQPRPKPTASPPVVVLFTDIAGSTAMTQEHGDEAAQEVIREHNRIVREAISAHQGREVKHTGDGIMASFTTGVNGVEAAIEMQRAVKVLVEKNSDNPLALKIGINVGEPISEDNDLFGATVQLAARIVDKARSGEILISEAVHGLTSGKKIPFEKHDEFEMKGFEHPITTYRVIWEKA